MRGSLKQRSPGVWSLIYDVPPPPGQERKQKKETFYGNRKAAEKRLNELVGSVQNGTYIAPSRLLTGDYCRKWLSGSVASTVAPTTMERYTGVVRLYIEPAIGHIPLQELRPHHVQDFYNKLAANYSPNTIRCIHNVLHRALSQATTLELLPRNPAAGLELPRCSPSKKDVLREDDIKTLVKAAEGSKYYLAVVLSAYTGMRAGEVCGLQWGDVDLEAKTVTVKRTAAKLNNQIIYKAPKTRSSLRVIDLPDVAVEALRNQRNWFKPHELICPYRPATFYAYLVALGKKLGIPVTPHALRHAHASLLGRLGEHVKVISERLGHGNIQTTLQTYTHLLPEQGKAAARKIDDAFS